MPPFLCQLPPGLDPSYQLVKQRLGAEPREASCWPSTLGVCWKFTPSIPYLGAIVSLSRMMWPVFPGTRGPCWMWALLCMVSATCGLCYMWSMLHVVHATCSPCYRALLPVSLLHVGTAAWVLLCVVSVCVVPARGPYYM